MEVRIWFRLELLPSPSDLHASGTVSCAHQYVDADRQVEQQIAEHHASCLSAARPAHSPAHTDCVLSRRQERQRELERLRSAVAPPPQVVPETPQAAPGSGPQPDWMI